MSAPLCWDAHGFARGVPYHDGALDGVVTDGAAQQVLLAIRATTGERHVLTLRGVVGLCVDGFREGNILLNLRMVRPTEARQLVAERLLLDAMTLPADVMIVLLESSFGAQVIAACGDVQVSERGATLVVAGDRVSHAPGAGSA